LLSSLVAYSQTLWPDLASGDLAASSSGGSGSGGSKQQQEPPRGLPAPPGSAAADFEAWAGEQGVAAAISIASFGAMRGCAATRDVAPGERLLSIPAEVLIYEDTVLQTDLVRAGGAVHLLNEVKSVEWLAGWLAGGGDGSNAVQAPAPTFVLPHARCRGACCMPSPASL
jgi:hypothetical protein